MTTVQLWWERMSAQTCSYRDERGREVHLRRPLPSAAGGEGTIYETSIPGIAAKIYLQPSMEKTAKLKVMLLCRPVDPAAPQGRRAFAWPTGILYTSGDDRAAGFLMARVSDAVILNVAINPVERGNWCQGFDWRCLCRAAANVAACVQSLHEAGYVVGDLKPENLMVSQDAIPTMVDLDSIQVPQIGSDHLRSPVGTPGYMPPELHGITLTGADRTPRHDAFSLAVIIYQILLGTHPFQGRYLGSGDPPDEDEAIRRGWWTGDPRSLVVEGRAHVAFGILNPELQSLFRACFGEGLRSPGRRPTAAAWHNALGRTADILRTCSGHWNHWYDPALSSCPWCKRRDTLGVDIFELGWRPAPAAPPSPPARPTPPPSQTAPTWSPVAAPPAWPPLPPSRPRRSSARCRARKLDGRRCGNSAISGNYGFCGVHR
jgi:DNA-binding helix-hairpin-helix protein with protein kinase domain